LIVDDEPSIRELARLLIETDDDGLEVVGEVADGRAAVAAALELHPEIVLLDVQMPEMDGFEVATRILEGTPDSRIIMFSASFTPRQEQRARSLGVRACVDKMDVITLPDVIRQVAGTLDLTA
jgi:DNA-binding NarL/FixJ family response regulator